MSENGEPCLVFHTIFNLSMRSKSFREMSVALLQRSDLAGLSVRELVGKACRITVIHKETDGGQTFANIASFKPTKPGTPPPRIDSDVVFFSLDPADAPDLKSLQRDFDALPESERTKIAASPSWRELLATRQLTKAATGKKAATIVNDSIPGEPDDSDPDDGFPANLM
jgi:hypothetical protein